MQTLESLRFDNTYARLPEGFHSRVQPTPFQRGARLVSFNAQAARLLDLDPAQATRAEFVEFFTGRRPLPGAEPIAALYAGHQFGAYVPQLGDGRALLLGEVRNARGEKWDVQLKRSGPRAIEAAMEQDYSEIDRLLGLLHDPCGEHPGMDAYAAESPEWARGLRLSCSS